MIQNKNIKKIIHANRKKFNIDKDEYDQLARIALWRTIIDWNKNRCTFLSYFSKRLKWMCLDELKKYKPQLDYHEHYYGPHFLIDHLDGLSEDEVSLLMDKFLYQYTYTEISKDRDVSAQAIYKRINKIQQKLNSDCVHINVRRVQIDTH